MKKIPRGVIRLKSIVELNLGSEVETANDNTKVSFTLRTHLRTYKILAKHKAVSFHSFLFLI